MAMGIYPACRIFAENEPVWYFLLERVWGAGTEKA